MMTPLTVRARRTVFVVPLFLLGLVPSVARSADPGKQPDLGNVYLDNGCYFLLSQVSVERQPKETLTERKKQAKLAVARKAALRMRAGAR
jgi:hypothetical protein